MGKRISEEDYFKVERMFIENKDFSLKDACAACGVDFIHFHNKKARYRRDKVNLSEEKNAYWQEIENKVEKVEEEYNDLLDPESNNQLSLLDQVNTVLKNVPTAKLKEFGRTITLKEFVMMKDLQRKIISDTKPKDTKVIVIGAPESKKNKTIDASYEVIEPKYIDTDQAELKGVDLDAN